ncbi:FG-GAP repeat domain-containing protein [Rhizohabitans arisaemae]|uniref:FG-GAP repeat domain-containing protein n=1 Tax=Rhizohabitans arisaemae TaxID=2720610 RepID=UPI0024B18C18|nr:VCBS repeat-containing protein [Rhizohabitans arisaemae]
MTASIRATAVAAALALAVLTVAPAVQAAPGDDRRRLSPGPTPIYHTGKSGKPSKPGKSKSKAWDISRIRAKAPAVAPEATARSGSSRAATAPVANDVTGDGRADLVAQLSSPDAGALRVYAGNGSTTSNPWESTFTTTPPQWEFADTLLVADVTGDNRADVVVRDPSVSNGTLYIYPNDGSGSANPWPSRFSAGAGWNIVDRILVGDVTGDGKPDLLARNPSEGDGTLYVYPNNGSVTSNPWTQSPIWSGNGWNLAQMMMLDDVTGDGKPEIVARDRVGALLVYPHNGSTTSNFWTSIVYGSTGGWSGTDRLTMDDVTGDGRPDVIARDTSGALWIHPWQSATAGSMWSPTTRFAAGTGFAYALDVVTGDVNGDGKPDLIAHVARSGDLWLLPNTKAATGNPWPNRVGAGTDWGFASQVLLADINGDRLQDLLAVDKRSANGTLWIYLNNGSTTGLRWTNRYFGGTGWNIFNHLMAGDVTGDGRADLVGRDGGGDLFAYPGNGSSTAFPWDPRAWVGSNWQTASRLTLGDVDRDGIADLIDLENDGSLWVFPTGASTDPIPVPGGWAGTRSIGLGYVTGAAGPDLVVGNASGAVSIYPHTGSTSGNPWSGTARPGGTGFQNAVSLVL